MCFSTRCSLIVHEAPVEGLPVVNPGETVVIRRVLQGEVGVVHRCDVLQDAADPCKIVFPAVEPFANAADALRNAIRAHNVGFVVERLTR